MHLILYFISKIIFIKILALNFPWKCLLDIQSVWHNMMITVHV